PRRRVGGCRARVEGDDWSAAGHLITQSDLAPRRGRLDRGQLTMNRREWLRMASTAAGVLLPASLGRTAQPARRLPEATPENLPRWRGFNLLDKFQVEGQKPFEERDFADIAEL